MKMIGLILAGGGSPVREMSQKATAALPVAGGFNAIDFSLSCMVHAGITSVAVISQVNSRHLNHHLKDSTWWDFGRKKGGLFLISPVVTPENQSWYDGTVEALLDAVDFMDSCHEPYVIIASGDGVYNMDFDKALDYHIEKGAEITIITAGFPAGRRTESFGQVKADGNGQVLSLSEKISERVSDDVSCGIYILRRRALISMLEEARLAGKKDFVTDVICPRIGDGRVYAYRHEGYWNSVTAADAYFSCNMDFLRPEVREEVFNGPSPILSKVCDTAPVKLLGDANVQNCVVTGGAVIAGEVADSVVFERVKIGKGAVVRNSILLPNTVVPEGMHVQDCIYAEKPRY
ncbi:MAG: glucose-1-phosphate adenylyltransferase subunit GlgD [Lachnospiraceae bacterium]|nr:glucose-1-phosphate adenylyltransferase subunit GlgD [Lachnospiraceae bacterium]